MSRRFNSFRVHNTVAIPTTTSTIVIGPTNIEAFDSFSILYQNSLTAIGLIGMQMQGAYDASGTAADQAPQWFNIPTATLAQPSALGPTAAVWTTAVTPNTIKWIRMIAATSSTAGIGTVSITIAGRMAN